MPNSFAGCGLGATGLSWSAIWPTVRMGGPKHGDETVSDFGSNRLSPCLV